MASNTSATTREQASHAIRTTRTATILNALKRRAQEVLNDKALDPNTRAIIRYALETHDPWLAKLVRRADAGESIIATFTSPQATETETSETQTRENNQHASCEDKIAALTEIICSGADESPAALLVLMGMFETSAQPNVLANTVKHHAFARCGELNLFGIVDTQIAVLEDELLAGTTAVS